MNWKAGDKCQSLKPNNEGMADCEIIRIFYDTKFCELKEIDSNYRWLATLDDCTCLHYFLEYWGEDCSLVGEDVSRCERCPNRPND